MVSIVSVFPVPGQPQTYILPGRPSLICFLQKSSTFALSSFRQSSSSGTVERFRAAFTEFSTDIPETIDTDRQVGTKVGRVKKVEEGDEPTKPAVPVI